MPVRDAQEPNERHRGGDRRLPHAEGTMVGEVTRETIDQGLYTAEGEGTGWFRMMSRIEEPG